MFIRSFIECFGDDQLFLIFETESGGKSLEDYPIQNIAEAKSVLHQVFVPFFISKFQMTLLVLQDFRVLTFY